jgi:hypothetical protein
VLAWIAQSEDQNSDGYIEYQSSSKKGLINQGWKDSGDAIVNADGSLAQLRHFKIGKHNISSSYDIFSHYIIVTKNFLSY